MKFFQTAVTFLPNVSNDFSKLEEPLSHNSATFLVADTAVSLRLGATLALPLFYLNFLATYLRKC